MSCDAGTGVGLCTRNDYNNHFPLRAHENRNQLKGKKSILLVYTYRTCEWVYYCKKDVEPYKLYVREGYLSRMLQFIKRGTGILSRFTRGEGRGSQQTNEFETATGVAIPRSVVRWLFRRPLWSRFAAG